MATPFEVKFTALADTLAKAKSSLETVESQARAEIAELIENGSLADVHSLIFHTFEVGGAEFICYPSNGALEIDSCSYKDLKLDKGPLAGKTVTMPSPDSETR